MVVATAVAVAMARAVVVATAMAVISPIIAYRLVEKTPLSFFYVRPDAFRLTGRKRTVRPDIVMAAGGD